MWFLRGWTLWLCFLVVIDSLGVELDKLETNDAHLATWCSLIAAFIITWEPSHDNT